ncbi:Rieske 2Fe-2S domain-containing protein [Humisphaera borealis]|uniref:Rieske 2Fe-2S domain-containing protein n=1 Tax=Humisphaera borealis TaxID=2807512 RepID=UPI0019D30422|nr:Rieske 2Fe-2S domain-containing protein [Humisphaera borealis]
MSADFVPGPVDAGPIADFTRDGIFDRFAMQGFFVVRRGTLIFAMSSVCTHQPVVLHAGQSDLGCPRHGSVFSADGIVLKAPARRALRRYALRLDDRAHLIVDTSVDFDEAGWKRPGAFLTTTPV